MVAAEVARVKMSTTGAPVLGKLDTPVGGRACPPLVVWPEFASPNVDGLADGVAVTIGCSEVTSLLTLVTGSGLVTLVAWV